MMDEVAAKCLAKQAAATVNATTVDSLATPILYTVPAQMLLYHTAVAKGTDGDRPRNLAKSVIV